MAYSASNSLFNNGAIAEFYWQFGDGTSSTEQEPVHVYANPGTYYVCVDLYMMLDGQVACTNNACAAIEVFYTDYSCNASFTYTTEEDGQVSFQNTSGDPDDEIYYEWNFGDNTFTTSEHNPQHVFSASGNYEVCLTQYINEGDNLVCTSIACEVVVIEPYEIACPEGEFPVSVQLTTTAEAPYNDFMVYSIWSENQINIFNTIGISGPATTYISQTCVAEGCYDVQVDFGSMNDDFLGELTISSPYMSSFTVNDYWGDIPWNSELCIDSSAAECDFEIEITDLGFNCFEFSMADGVYLNDVLWDFGDGETLTASTTITHCYDLPGTYSVANLLSYGNCENVLNQSMLIVEPLDSCSSVDLVFSYTMPEPVYWMILDSEFNVLLEYFTEGFSEENPTIIQTICLPDGCYTLQTEGLYLEDSTLFQVAGFLNGEEISFVLTEMNNPNQYEFGVNSNCNEVVEDCDANFEPIFNEDNMLVDFENTSVFSGNAQWTWSYDNGTYSYDTDGSVLFSSGGIYEVCLTITTENCSDTYCEYIIANGQGECTENIVEITIDADYSGEIVSDLLSATFYWNGLLASCNGFSLQEGTNTVHYCLPDGCFDLEIEGYNDWEIQADSLILFVETEFGETQLEWNELLGIYTGEFGIDADCFENVNDAIQSAEILVYPNPSSGIIQFNSSQNTRIESMEVLDSTGRTVYKETNPSGLTDLAFLTPGYYLIRLITSEKQVTLPLQLIR